MKSFIAVLALVAVASADVSHIHSSEKDAQIVSQNSNVEPNGFQYDFKTSNGIAGQESGALKNAGREDEAIEVQGNYQYLAPDGSNVQLTYIANENGYQPQGSHLPTPPAPQPIPDYISRSLEYIRTHPSKENQN